MTREEAIQVLKEYRTIVMNCLEAKTPAFDMAIDVLSADAVEVKAEQLPPKVPTEWINDGVVLVPQHDWNETQKKLEEYISADAVEVVRCKDCKHWHEWENATGSCLRSENGCNWFGTDAIDYCSFGERKNDSE